MVDVRTLPVGEVARILMLELLQTLRVVGLHPAVPVAPPVIRLPADPQFLRRLGIVLPSPISRSASRNLRMICSGVCLRRFIVEFLPRARDSHKS